MLARTADNLFWLARSMERADFIARTIEATLRLEYLPRSGVDDPGVEWEGALNAVGAYDGFIADARRDRRGERDRLSHLRSRQPVLDLQLPGKRARQRPRGAHRADGRDLDRDQRRLARAQALRGDAARRQGSRPRGAHPLPRLRQEGLARFRRLLLSHDAAQRRLLVQSARHLRRARRQHRAAARREIPSAAAVDRRRSAARSTISSGWRSCAPCRRRPPITGSIAIGSSRG